MIIVGGYMSLNINNLVEFQQQFENLEKMVGQLGGSRDEKENSEVIEKINTQISLLLTSTTTNFPTTFKESLEKFQEKLISTSTTVEMDKLTKDLENIRQLIIPKSSSSSSSSSIGEKSKLVPKKTTIEQIPRAILLLILEFAFSTKEKANLSTVSPQWKNLIEDSKFWNMAIKEFEMVGIDPSKPPKEAFIERIEEDVKVYEELFPEIPKDLSPIEKYKYCKNSEKFKKIIYNAFSTTSPDSLSVAKARAILDINLPISYSIFATLGVFPLEIQKELVKRVAVQQGDLPVLEKEIDKYIENQFAICREELVKKLESTLETTRPEPEMIPPVPTIIPREEIQGPDQMTVPSDPLITLVPDQFNEMVQRATSAMKLINAKREELKKFYHVEMQYPESLRQNFSSIVGMSLYGLDRTVQLMPLLPILKTQLEIYSNLPMDKEVNQACIELAKKLGLKDIVELLEGHLLNVKPVEME